MRTQNDDKLVNHDDIGRKESCSNVLSEISRRQEDEIAIIWNNTSGLSNEQLEQYLATETAWQQWICGLLQNETDFVCSAIILGVLERNRDNTEKFK